MLLHNSYVNVAITHVLHYQKSLFEHKGLRNINSDSWKTPNLALPTFARQVPTLSLARNRPDIRQSPVPAGYPAPFSGSGSEYIYLRNLKLWVSISQFV
jgi:hypothetical protein